MTLNFFFFFFEAFGVCEGLASHILAITVVYISKTGSSNITVLLEPRTILKLEEDENQTQR